MKVYGDISQDLDISFKVIKKVEDVDDYLEKVWLAIYDILKSYKKCNFEDCEDTGDWPEELVPGVVYQLHYKVYSYIRGTAYFSVWDEDVSLYDADDIDIDEGSFYDESIKEVENQIPGFVLVDSKFSDFDPLDFDLEMEYEEPEPPDWYYDDDY